MKELKYVGKETVRLLGPQIVTGKAKYTGDFKLPGMQYGKILRSPHPYAKILSIDVEKAKAYPGVSAVVTSILPMDLHRRSIIILWTSMCALLEMRLL